MFSKHVPENTMRCQHQTFLLNKAKDVEYLAYLNLLPSLSMRHDLCSFTVAPVFFFYPLKSKERKVQISDFTQVAKSKES